MIEINSKIIILIIILILLIFCYFNDKMEYFDDKSRMTINPADFRKDSKPTDKDVSLAGSNVRSANRDEMAFKMDILDDPLFKDVIVYNNDQNPYEEGGKIGLAKCLEGCDGKCVEFGVSGITFCFPK